MESLIESHKCSICGKVCVITLFSIGTSHQWIVQVICPACVTQEHLDRVGRYPVEFPQEREEEPQKV
jgi:hypothetical protein